MPRFQGATYFTMKGGLNSEASPLNIPQQDAIDLSNIDINIDGSIERRRGIDFISRAYLNSPIADYTGKMDVAGFTQFSPIKDDGEIAKFIVMRFGGQVHIYNYESPDLLKDTDAPLVSLTIAGISQDCLYNTTWLPEGNKLFIINAGIPFGYIQYVDGPTFTWVDVVPRHRVNDETTSTVTDLPVLGWRTACTQGSRIWVAGVPTKPNTVFFSKTIVNGDEHGDFFQVADPFSATDNVLVDTDGGSIQLTGAERIIALAPLGAGVMIFANNGVWAIGGQDGFRPTSYSINKISDAGIAGEKCWCAVEQQLIFFGKSNIYTVLLGTSIDTPEVQIIGDKIHNFYRNIPQYCLSAGNAIYNSELKKVYFFTNFEGSEWFKSGKLNDSSTMLRDALVMDVRLNAWSTYSLSKDTTGSKLAISDVKIFNNGKVGFDDVVDGGVVVEDDGVTVTTQRRSLIGSTLVTNLLLVKRSGTSWKVAFGELVGEGLTDFSESLEDAEDNLSYITIAHQLFKDAAHRKFAPYIIPLFKRVESGVLDSNGVDITPGGCKYRVDWDWAVNSNSKKFGTLRDAYFPYKFTTSMFDGGDNGLEVVTSKLKIRGSGQVFKLHFESDGNKDFKLYGWQIMLHAKGRV